MSGVVDVILLHLVLGGVVDQTLQDAHLLVVTRQNTVLEKISLLSQVSLGNESGCECINFLHQVLVKLNLEVLGLLYHIVDLLNVLADVLVVIVVVLLRQESFYLKLVFKLYVQVFSLFSEFHCDIDSFAVGEGSV